METGGSTWRVRGHPSVTLRAQPSVSAVLFFIDYYFILCHIVIAKCLNGTSLVLDDSLFWNRHIGFLAPLHEHQGVTEHVFDKCHCESRAGNYFHQSMRQPSCLAVVRSQKSCFFFPVGLSRLPRLRNAFIPSASMTAVRRNCKLKTDRDRRGGVGANLWSWVLFGDRSWSVTCSRCCWWSWQGLAPDPQTTAACKQEGQSWHSCTSRSNSWRMSRATSGLHTSTVYASAACLNQQGTVSSIIILKKHDNYPKTS